MVNFKKALLSMLTTMTVPALTDHTVSLRISQMAIRYSTVMRPVLLIPTTFSSLIPDFDSNQLARL